MRQLTTVILIGSLAFFAAGWYEWSQAKDSALWPGRAAMITEYQVCKGDDSGDYVAMEGIFVDTGRTFSVKRYAYGVVNGMSPSQAYLVPYKPGFLTTVYVDPKDSGNVILCNVPSLAFQYGELAVTGVLSLASLWCLIFGRKKTAGLNTSRPPVQTAKTVELPRWAGVGIGVAMAFLFAGLGLWMIHMGVVGHSPAEEWSPGEAKIVILMGILFAYGGLVAMVGVIWGDRLPPIANRIVLSLFLVILGLPFLAIPILDPGGISSSVSVNRTVVHTTQGSSVGAVVFSAVGVLCMAGAFWPWRWWRKRR